MYLGLLLVLPPLVAPITVVAFEHYTHTVRKLAHSAEKEAALCKQHNSCSITDREAPYRVRYIAQGGC